MARASIYTHISLDRAAAILGIDPMHFNSVQSDFRPEQTACDDFWFQYPSQRIGQAAREDLALALNTAEQKTFWELGYPLLPVWVVGEEQTLPRPYAVELASRRHINSRGYLKSIRAANGFIIEAGVRAKLLIVEGTAVGYEDRDADGYDETAVVTFPTTVTNRQEIHAYYPSKDGEDTWEIRPISVSISAGVATITFKKELAVLPELWEKYASPDDPTLIVDGDANTNFLSSVDVYRVYNDPSQQATLYSENLVGYTPIAPVTATLQVRNGPLGLFAYEQADWDSVTSTYVPASTCNSDPQRMVLNYRAGKINNNITNPYLEMEPRWERAIVYYAVSLLDREVSGCENTHNIWARMTEDLGKQDGNTSFTINFDDVRNPFGTTRAGMDLWKMIKRERRALR